MSIPQFYHNVVNDIKRLKQFSNPETRDKVIDDAPELSAIEKEAVRSGDHQLISTAIQAGGATVLYAEATTYKWPYK